MDTVLLLTPPFTQLNTPYPATAYLQGYLKKNGIFSRQADLGIEVLLALFTNEGLKEVFGKARSRLDSASVNGRRIYALKEDYLETIDLVVGFLQGKNPTLAMQICEEGFLPQASRFDTEEDLEWAFGSMGIQDKAKHMATLYLDDLSDFIQELVDPHFGFSRYAERLGRSANSFDTLYQELNKPDSLLDGIALRILQDKIEMQQPGIVGISIPFPGNLYFAFKCGQWIQKNYPGITVVMGGGFINTELRTLADPRVFEFVDFITLDDGEAPFMHILEWKEGIRPFEQLKRTFYCKNNEVDFADGSLDPDVSQKDTGTPDYTDMLNDKYLSVLEVNNPMHRLWSDGRWNKLTLAHGCYWGRCTFCDTTLDYIKRFEPNLADVLCKRIEDIITQTGQTGFHFVDEAAPPALLKTLSIELIRRKIKITWWANIRFEKNFTSDLCVLLKEAGCIAVSGGLEVASDRILRLINKGVNLEQVARVCNHFTQAGIMVHAYLMYGFPTQTMQETIDSMEVVRQLFEQGLVQSGFWHQFALTAHSPVGLNPDTFGIHIENSYPGTFAVNDLKYIDPQGVDHEIFSEGLSKSLFNYMHGIGFEFDLKEWFDFAVPATHIPPHFITRAIRNGAKEKTGPNGRMLWLGKEPALTMKSIRRKGKEVRMAELIVRNKKYELELQLEAETGVWLADLLHRTSVLGSEIYTFSQVEEEYRHKFQNEFQALWQGEVFLSLRDAGFICI